MIKVDKNDMALYLFASINTKWETLAGSLPIGLPEGWFEILNERLFAGAVKFRGKCFFPHTNFTLKK